MGLTAKITPTCVLEFRKQNIKKHDEMRRDSWAYRVYHDSKWPFTDRLSSEEIIVMRDTYAGHRKQATKLVTKSPYERIFHLDCGWDQFKHRDDRQRIKLLQLSGKNEEKYRTVPITANSIYGRRDDQFYDFLSGHLRKELVCDENKASIKLPSLPGNDRRTSKGNNSNQHSDFFRRV